MADSKISKYLRVDTDTISLGKVNSIIPRIMSISVDVDDTVTFTELCDGYFEVSVSKKEAIKILNDMLQHINEHT